MRICIYCGKPVGQFHNKHLECRQKHEKELKEYEEKLAKSLSTKTMASFLPKAREILLSFFLVGWLPLLISTALASENGANDYLLTVSPKAQAERLGKVVQLFGDPCTGRVAFYMGDAKDHAAFWSVKCGNNRSYEVEIKPDGTGAILECPVLEALHAGHCFKKFE